MTGLPNESSAEVERGGGIRYDDRVAPGRAEIRAADRARDAAEAGRDRFAFLAETSRCLADSLDYETTLATVAALSLPYLGAWCIVDICMEESKIRRIAVIHPDPERQKLARELHERYPPHAKDRLGPSNVIASGRPELVAEVSDAALQTIARDDEHLRLLRDMGIGAYVVVPMKVRGNTLGAITFVTTESGRRFGDLDLLLAEDVANRSAIAISNARLHAAALEAKKESDSAREEADAAREKADAIAGYAGLMELGVHGPVTPEQRADLARIQMSQRHLLGLIDGVLGYSRVEGGVVQFNLDDVSISRILSTCEAMMTLQYAERSIEFERDEIDASTHVRADAEELQQVILNLLTNALKFTEPGGRVKLGCTAGQDTVDIEVSDSGRGISEEHLDRVFEPFVQLDSRLTRSHGGVGLGLAISRDLARGMGGDLRVSSAIGKGSTFTVTLPRV